VVSGGASNVDDRRAEVAAGRCDSGQTIQIAGGRYSDSRSVSPAGRISLAIVEEGTPHRNEHGRRKATLAAMTEFGGPLDLDVRAEKNHPETDSE
jgi:hypothetical protein